MLLAISGLFLFEAPKIRNVFLSQPEILPEKKQPLSRSCEPQTSFFNRAFPTTVKFASPD
jgi:hypothetical protein